MAARAAHSTSSLQTKPSIFEVVAQESLTEDVRPAFKRVIKFLSSCNPVRYGWIDNWCDEAYLLLNSFIQYNYLKHRSASFEETFYGLERVSLKASRDALLSSKQKYLSLICLSLLPYINSKWEKEVEKLNLDDTNYDDRLFSIPKNFKESFVKFYRLFHFSWRIISLVQYLLYMTGRSESHSFILRLTGMSLVYRKDSEQKTVRDLWKSAWKDRSKFPDISAELLVRTLTFGMEMGAFFLQCLNWYYSNQNEQKLSALPIPKPPNRDENFNKLDNKCPVCNKKRKIETALITSGEVFCFKCIKSVLDSTGKCPVSGIPSTINDLVRIYHQ